MKRFLVLFITAVLSSPLMAVAADAEGLLGTDSNPSPATALDRVFQQIKQEGRMTPFSFQERMHGGGLDHPLLHGLPAHGGQRSSGAQALVDRFFSEEFEPTPYTELDEDGASDSEGQDSGGLSLPFFEEEESDSQAPPEDQDSEGLDTWMAEDWLWSPEAYPGDTWYAPQVWGGTGQ